MARRNTTGETRDKAVGGTLVSTMGALVTCSSPSVRPVFVTLGRQKYWMHA
jgi:hypothetical protein